MFAAFKQIKILLLVCTASFLVTACEQTEDVTIHEPGVYQGASDNLVTDVSALQERIKNQMDR